MARNARTDAVAGTGDDHCARTADRFRHARDKSDFIRPREHPARFG
jgi:hypothetical protein